MHLIETLLNLVRSLTDSETLHRAVALYTELLNQRATFIEIGDLRIRLYFKDCKLIVRGRAEHELTLPAEICGKLRSILEEELSYIIMRDVKLLQSKLRRGEDGNTSRSEEPG